MDRETAVAPGAIAAIAGDDHMMQRVALALGRAVGFFPRAPHAGKPRLRDELRLQDVLQIDDREDVVGVAVEMRRAIRIAPAGPPQAIDAETRHLEESDLARLCGIGLDVVDRE